MEFTEIDRQFDEAFERINRRGLTTASPYGGTPLAADHFLLKKSWDYFRNRVKSIEDQWRKMLSAKDVQLKTVTDELKRVRQSSLELEDEIHMLRSLDQSIKKARTEDFVGFNRKSEMLRMRWDAERAALIKKADDLELKITRLKKDYDLRASMARVREEKLQQALEAAKKDSAINIERERDIQKKCTDELNAKDERIFSLDTKTELLRGEVERRDALLKEMKATLATRDADATAMTSYIAELQRLVKEKDIEIEQHKTRLQILSQEKDGIQAGWERERAEWRELWDRGRSLWDKKAS